MTYFLNEQKFCPSECTFDGYDVDDMSTLTLSIAPNSTRKIV